MTNLRRLLGAAPVLFVWSLVPACAREWTLESPGVPDDPVADCSSFDSVTPEVLAYDANASPELALAQSTLYWVDRGSSIRDTIQAMPLTGGAARTLYRSSPDSSAAIEDLVTDGTTLYFLEVSEEGLQTSAGFVAEVKSVPVGGGKAAVLATVDNYEFTLTLASGYIYFTDGQTVQRVASAGGAVESVGGASPGGLTSRGGAVYWTDDSGNLVKLASPDGKPQTLVRAQSTEGASLSLANLVANDHDLFWICNDDSGDLLCGTPERGDNVQRVLTAVTQPADMSAQSTLVADESNVYVIAPAGACGESVVQEVPVEGGTPVTIAGGFSMVEEVSTAHAMVVDDTYVYWVGSGQVLRAAK